MPNQSRQSRIYNITNRLGSEISYSRQKVSTSVQARKLNEQYEAEAEKLSRFIKVYKETMSIQKAFLKDLKNAKANRQKLVKDTIYAGFYNVKNIIPNASEVDLDIQADAVRLVKRVRGEKLSICKRDGSAYNSMLAFYATVNLLKMSKFENFMIMDEALSVVSANKSEEFSLYLPYLARGLVLVLIEQKDEIFVKSGEIIEYAFKNVGGVTQIRRVS